MKKFWILTVLCLIMLSGISFCYSNSSADYKKACGLIKKEKYQQAVDILSPLADDSTFILNDHAAFRLARALDASGNKVQAEEEYKSFIERFPESAFVPKAFHRLGEFGVLRADLLAAAANPERGDPLQDDRADAVWKDGFSLYKSGDFEGAFVKLGECPEDADPRIVAKCVFWRAKSALKAGMIYEAQKLLEYIAGYYPYTYYGMRACQTMDVRSQNIPGTGVELPRLSELSAENAHFEKYKELVSIGLYDDAISEANAMVASGPDEYSSRLGKLCASLALNAKKDYCRSIKALEKGGGYDFYSTDIDGEKYLAMNLAYPEAFKSQVRKYSKKYGVDPFLMFALIREESRFDPKAVSRSKARGLSQIMPRTGRGIAKKLYIKPYRTSKLHNPSLNIKMGTYYFSLLLKRFNGDKYLALASYNGGAGNVDKWLNNIEYSDVDEFVESIPFSETRLYVKKVLESYWQYKRLYEGS